MKKNILLFMYFFESFILKLRDTIMSYVFIIFLEP